MAATLVGGAFLSASVQTMMDQLTSTEFRDYITSTKLNDSLLKQLGTLLRALQVVLNDAEQKQVNDPDVKQWLDDLKDEIYDAEDLLNQISYDSLRCKVENTEAENVINRVRNLLSSPFSTFYGEINSQMKDTCERLQSLVQQTVALGLQKTSGRVSSTRKSSSVNQLVMVGREDDKKRLMNMLLSDSGMGNSKLGVVAISGMGGVGKTTLAKLLYNDEEVQKHFDLQAWVCVSEDFDILRVTKTLLEYVAPEDSKSNNLDILQVKLKQKLSGKRFLFVLDDLWNDSYNEWCQLVTPFIDGKSGSKVIITTRNQTVAEVARTYPVHEVQPLSDEECWSLLSKHALKSEDFDINKYPELEAIGKKIAKKCGGLPIAATTLGGLLRSNVDAKEWTAILKSNIWNLPNDNILPALHLSYQYLPSYLKRCFAYCSIFPKDYPFNRKQLVLLWMAEGFLEHSQDEKAAEEVGDDHFVQLLSRSLIQKSHDDTGEEKFIMHDLVNDLATVVSGKSCRRLECGNVPENVRHLSYNSEYYDIFKKFKIFYDFKCLRSLLSIGDGWEENYLSKKVVDDLLPTLRRLRVLSLSNYRNITMLPDSIGKLVQLRYLDLSKTGIEILPDTTGNLYNLQTLILSGCKNLTGLPVHIGKLINLRHLDISETNIKEMPMQIVGLENLQTLTVFVVGKRDGGLSVRELGKFPNLGGKLCIKKLHNVVDATEAYDVNLKSKKHIQELELQWGKQTEDSQTAKAVLSALQPSINLKKLSIGLYSETSFPSWLGDSSFSNMVSLSISDCEYCVMLPPLGQLPSLKDLKIDGMPMLETIGPEFYGMEGGCSNYSFQPFPSLENLEFLNMSNWKEWFPFDGSKFPFPHLKTLTLNGCPELRGDLPSHLSSIEQFQIHGCDRLLAMSSTLHWLSSIKNIDIEGDLGPRWSTERTQWSLLGSDSPCLLKDVSIGWCDTLLSVPKMILSSTCLQHLTLLKIPSLTAFPTNGLPTSLQSIYISYCENLSFLPPQTWSNYTSLQSLMIWNSCKSLTSFPLDCFPALQHLTLWSCECLESIFISESSSLRPLSLQSLSVYLCKALRSLPQRMDTLTALESLSLKDNPELMLSFSEGACLPPKLRSIEICYLRITMPVTEWGLQHLTTLSYLSIGGDDDIVTTLLKERLLPISLVSLTITNLSEMKSLEGNGLRHLSSLETLLFEYCPGLESLPEDRLPSSLKRLSIQKCPLLEARYESERGEHWSNIAHIPVIDINDHVTI